MLSEAFEFVGVVVYLRPSINIAAAVAARRRRASCEDQAVKTRGGTREIARRAAALSLAALSLAALSLAPRSRSP